jgi:hypothetical protein
MTLAKLWGYSSVGRALAWHARGQQFDSAYLHQRFAENVTIKVTK